MSTTITTQVRSVLIPLVRHLMLVPNVVVAEVLNYTKPLPRQDAPEWLLGDLAWRGRAVPVVSLDGLLGEPVVEPVYRGRTIILNAINGTTPLPHIGIIAQSIPSLVHATTETVRLDEWPGEQNDLVKQAVAINERQAFIPELDELERLVLSTLKSQAKL